MEIIKQQQQGLTLAPAAFSQKLMQCLIKLETTEKADAKMELLSMTSELMPGGKPTYLEVIKYPMIRQLVQTEGKKKMLAVLVLMVKDLCSSLNVVRNMNEDQMIEAAAMLLDECGNFRLEDYVMMFSMGKRGQLIKIYDRIDVQVISHMMDVYWEKRKAVAEAFAETEAHHFDTLGNAQKSIENQNEQDARLVALTDKLTDSISRLKELAPIVNTTAQEAKKQIIIN